MTDTVSLSIILNKKLLTGITATQRHLSQNWSPSYPLSLRTNKAKRNAPVSIGTTAALEHVYSFTSSQKTSTLTSQASQLANERLTFSCNTHDDGHSKKKKKRSISPTVGQNNKCRWMQPSPQRLLLSL